MTISDKMAEWWPFVTKRTMDRYIEQTNDDYQHTHDVLWKILNLLCEESVRRGSAVHVPDRVMRSGHP